MNKRNLALVAASASLLVSTSINAGDGCSYYKNAVQTAAYQPLGHDGAMSGFQRVAHHGSAGHSDAKTQPDIVETAAAAGSFSTLVTAVKEAGLVDTLKGKGPFTVFAPTDEAFAKLPKGTLEALLADKEKLTKILTYHVVPGQLDSSAVVGMENLSTVEGSDLPVSDIKIAKTDIVVSNGVIHVIDEVLIP